MSLSDADENYEDEPRSPGNGTGALRTSPRSPRSPVNGTGSFGIAGLVNPPEQVEPPSGPDVPAHMRRGIGQVVNFGQNIALPFDDEEDNRMSANSQGDEFANFQLQGSEDDQIRDFVTNFTVRAIQQENPDAVIRPTQIRGLVEMTEQQLRQQHQQQQRRQDRQQDRQQQARLTIILRNCDRRRFVRLVRIILSPQLNHATRLRYLDQILERPQRMQGDATTRRSHSRELRRLGLACRSSQARRALYAFFSVMRDQVASQLTERRNSRSLRRPQQSPQSPPQSKGGKRQTKKRAFKRNKTVKRR